jgi:hypothetical protein
MQEPLSLNWTGGLTSAQWVLVDREWKDNPLQARLRHLLSITVPVANSAISVHVTKSQYIRLNVSYRVAPLVALLTPLAVVSLALYSGTLPCKSSVLGNFIEAQPPFRNVEKGSRA